MNWTKGTLLLWANTDPKATLTIKLKSVVSIGARTVAKASIILVVGGETTKQYCKIARGS